MFVISLCLCWTLCCCSLCMNLQAWQHGCCDFHVEVLLIQTWDQHVKLPISSNKEWYSNSPARQTISQALRLTNCTQSCWINKERSLEFVELNLSAVWLKKLSSDETGEEKLCKYFIRLKISHNEVLLTVSISLSCFFFFLLRVFPPLAVLWMSWKSN